MFMLRNRFLCAPKIFATLGFMQNRQNGRSRRPAAHSSYLAISGLEHENDAPRAARGRAPCATILTVLHKPKRCEYLWSAKKTISKREDIAPTDFGSP